MEPPEFFIPLLIFIMAILYSSVGHGGASGYLAVLSFFNFLPDEMATTALCLNILVSSIAFFSFWRAGHFSWSLTWPFIVTSIPAAFIGGLIDLPKTIYYIILALVLLFAAVRMGFGMLNKEEETTFSIRKSWAFASGTGIGLVSGLIGVGGGIFLSPLMILMKWASAKQTAAVSAVFIFVNAASGLFGRFFRDGLIFGDLGAYLIAGFLGGLIGSYWGAHRVSNQVLKRILAVVLAIASVKLLLYVIHFS